MQRRQFLTGLIALPVAAVLPEVSEQQGTQVKVYRRGGSLGSEWTLVGTPPPCAICHQPIWPGEAVVCQGGPHMSCAGALKYRQCGMTWMTMALAEQRYRNDVINAQMDWLHRNRGF
jgi:hypothetical protein